MTKDEADKIARVIATADGGCSVCISNLCELLNEADLGFSFEMEGGFEMESDYRVSARELRRTTP